MLSGSDVPPMMSRVREGLEIQRLLPEMPNPIIFEGEGLGEYGIAILRDKARLKTDLRPKAYGRLKGLKALVKRIILRGIGWYLFPLHQQQSEFNESLIGVIEKLREAVADLELKVARLQAQQRRQEAQDRG